MPIADEQPLYYYNWVQGNIKKVSDATAGKVGYLHIPDMQQTGLNEFAKHYYPQLRKKALIIDVRGNGGGNVSPMIIERLRREIAMYAFSRDTPARPEPDEIFLGPKVCLMNEFSASDGDLFPYRTMTRSAAAAPPSAFSPPKTRSSTPPTRRKPKLPVDPRATRRRAWLHSAAAPSPRCRAATCATPTSPSVRGATTSRSSV